jgi:hypothetical protein
VEGGGDQTIPLNAGVNTNPAETLAAGQYLLRVTLEKSGAYARLVEVLHIYPGQTSVLPAKIYTDGDFAASAPAAPAKPLIALIKSGNTQTLTNQGGTITITWQAVSGATEYEVYYAPYVTDSAPSIPESPAQTLSAPATSVTITAADIGNDTMNYYAWVKAKNASGTSPASPPAGSLDRFYGVWMAGNGMDGYEIDNAKLRYLMSWADPDGAWDIFTFIRAIVPFENGSETVNFNGKTGAAGIIVVEYDDSVDSNMYWSHFPGKYFIAIYYYGLTGNGAGSSAYLGFAADLEGDYGDPDYGADVSNVDEAIAKFTLADKDLYIFPDVAVIYNWGDRQ